MQSHIVLESPLHSQRNAASQDSELGNTRDAYSTSNSFYCELKIIWKKKPRLKYEDILIMHQLFIDFIVSERLRKFQTDFLQLIKLFTWNSCRSHPTLNWMKIKAMANVNNVGCKKCKLTWLRQTQSKLFKLKISQEVISDVMNLSRCKYFCDVSFWECITA